MSDTTKFQVNFKTGTGYDATLINVYADNEGELDLALDALSERIPAIVSVEALLHAGGATAPVVNVDVPTYQQPPSAPSAPPAAPAPASAPAGAPETVYDRYQNAWTYNRGDAPDLPDGRGKYAFKDWTDAKGQARKAWMDPAKGPKSFPKGAAEAPVIWA